MSHLGLDDRQRTGREMNPLRRCGAMALRVTWFGAAASLLAACGGSPSNGVTRDEAATGDVQTASAEGRGKGEMGPDPQAQRANQLGAEGSTSAQGHRYDLIVLNERVVHQDLDQLDPRQGKGYQPLRAFIYVKGMPRNTSPVASIKPVCMVPTRCEYLPPRKSGLAERYIVSIPDDSVAQLSADEDVVVVSTRHLGLANAATVDLTLTIPGQRTVVKRIVYGAVPG